MIPKIRLFSQQIIEPKFEHPQDLVHWMGAIQAQDYPMAKWAVATRLKSKSLISINQAIDEAKIVRTHILRPTWHFVSSEDIYWMIELSKARLIAINNSMARALDITEEEYTKANKFFEKRLRDNQYLTKQEIRKEVEAFGIQLNENRLNRFLIRAEVEGIICSGANKAGKSTYGLLAERVPYQKSILREEALARLCKFYFRSHSPATLEDFIWWSGLSTTEARKAVDSIKADLIEESINGKCFFIYKDYKMINNTAAAEQLTLLAPFDEYLISYKDRSDVLSMKDYPKAFTRYGIFFPVILHNGKVIGNWKRATEKRKMNIECSFFDERNTPPKELLESVIKESLIGLQS